MDENYFLAKNCLFYSRSLRIVHFLCIILLPREHAIVEAEILKIDFLTTLILSDCGHGNG